MSDWISELQRISDSLYDDGDYSGSVQIESVIQKYSWHPIATAPKDGSEFLTCNGRQGKIRRLVFWNKVHSRWQSKGEVILSLQDTYWMPIPELYNPESEPA